MRGFLNSVSRRPGLSAFLIAFALLAVMSGAWALASPMLSGPDEHSHLIKAAGVVRGQFAGDAIPGSPGFRAVTVPDYFNGLERGMCFVFRESVPAGCAPGIDGSNSQLVSLPTAAGTYNPLYYLLIGWPSLLLEDLPALYAMRLVGVVVNAALIASGFAALALRRSRSFSLLGAAIAITPMVLFLISVVNPSGLEIAAAFALASWLALLSSRGAGAGAGLTLPIIGVAVSAAVLANTRAVGPVWAAVILGIFLVDGRLWRPLLRSRTFWFGVGTIGVSVAVAAWWIIVGAGGSEPREGLEGTGSTTFEMGFKYMMSLTLQNWHGYIGVFGWLDTKVPDTIVIVWAASMLAIVAAGVIIGRGWPLVKLILMVGAFVLLPALLQGAQWNEVGFIWQARYLLAIIVALLVLAGATLDDALGERRADSWRSSRLLRFSGLAVIAMSLMHVFAFCWSLKRYLVGLGADIPWPAMWNAPQWQTPWIDWRLLALAFAVTTTAWLGLAALAALTPRRSAPSPDPATTGEREPAASVP